MGKVRGNARRLYSPSEADQPMKTIKSDSVSDLQAQVAEIVAVLEDGGVVCMPCGGAYRLVADLYNERAVMEMMQAKRRVSTSPSLVFVSEEQMLEQAAARSEERRVGKEGRS